MPAPSATPANRTICAEAFVNHNGRDMLAFIVAIPGGDPWHYRSAVCDDRDLLGGPYAYGRNDMGAETPQQAYHWHRRNIEMYACANQAAGGRCTHFDADAQWHNRKHREGGARG